NNWDCSILLRLEHDYAQRRQSDSATCRLAVRRNILGVDPSGVADITATEHFSVAIENFPVSAVARQADQIALARYRSKVAAENQEIATILSVARETNHARLGIAKIDPFEAAKV